MGPASSADLGELTNQTLADVGSFMNELRKRGLVERVGGQKAPSGMTMAVWALTDACGTFSDAELDDMHHALGRPDGPHVEPYRNYYCIDADCDQAKRMAMSPGWERFGQINQGRDALFAVTDEGRAAMFAWLAEAQRAKGLRNYFVTADGVSSRTVLAKSPSAAKHSMYLDLSDAGWCPQYREFLELNPRARLLEGAQHAGEPREGEAEPPQTTAPK
jgi:hypothetical protein